MKENATLNHDEINKFSNNDWWNSTSKEAKMLHKITPIRLEYIKEICGNIEGKNILDIGCGGGLISEPLARRGGVVTGIDPSEKNILSATSHAAQEEIKIKYFASTIEEFNQDGFDIVLAMDVVEHVANVKFFLQECIRKLTPGGILIVSTINKTLLSLLFAKFASEYILGIVPRGTHDYDKFISPKEIKEHLDNVAIQRDLRGFTFDPKKMDFTLTKNTNMNYFITFMRNE
jgi:2-polyprenyl-6-hydroxyphenyl methylase/3-demethylubiquinone-9 3-methyltransferase